MATIFGRLLRPFSWFRRSVWRMALGIFIGVVVLGAIGFVLGEFVTAPSVASVTPIKAAAVASSDVAVSSKLRHYDAEKVRVRVQVDGRELPSKDFQLTSGSLRFQQTFPDGPHSVQITLSSRNIFSRNRTHLWSFTVDTQPPEVQVVTPSSPTSLPSASVVFRAQFNEPAVASLTLDGKSIPLENLGKSASGRLQVAEGRHNIVLAVKDAAGNVSTKRWDAWADFYGPKIKLGAWPGNPWKASEASLALKVKDNLPDQVTATATIDGKPVKVASQPTVYPKVAPLIYPIDQTSGDQNSSQATEPVDSTTTTSATKKSGSKSNTTGSTSSTAPVVSLGSVNTTTRSINPADVSHWGAKRFVISTGQLSEGVHQLVVTVQDSGGHTYRSTQTIVVDSTETFGPTVLTSGALGNDVKRLQEILIARKLLKSKPTGVFDQATAQAVVSYKRSQGLSPTPIVDRETLKRLLGYIVIDRINPKLTFYKDGKLVKVYGCATGQPRYPTPKGNFHIIVKERNPTWNPPPSPWAAGLEPVPPGPGNPLGTRWMGLSTPAIGIHGTPSSGSIGSRASHGCIRMHISDAEELFEQVYVGTPVDIVG